MQKRNYQKELEKFLEHLKNSKRRPKLLLHSCCAPCSSYPIEYLYPYFEITVFFYNPNLYPEHEYQIRLEEQQRFCREFSKNSVIPAGFSEIKVVDELFIPDEFYNKIKGYEQEKEGGERCKLCFDLRLERSFKKALKIGAEFLTTTLTISPLKNASLLNGLGKMIGQNYPKVAYLETDFKKKGGFLRSTELSKEYKLYRQNYCGCVFSYQEMNERAK